MAIAILFALFARAQKKPIRMDFYRPRLKCEKEGLIAWEVDCQKRGHSIRFADNFCYSAYGRKGDTMVLWIYMRRGQSVEIRHAGGVNLTSRIYHADSTGWGKVYCPGGNSQEDFEELDADKARPIFMWTKPVLFLQGYTEHK
jgi:hypothetical protein